MSNTITSTSADGVAFIPGAKITFDSTTTAFPLTASVTPNASGLVGIRGVLTIEGEETGDGRKITPNAVFWEEGPWSLMGRLDNSGHDGAPVIGRIDKLSRGTNGRINFEGVVDANAYPEIVDAIEKQLLRGISLDPDMVEMEFQDEQGNVVDPWEAPEDMKIVAVFTQMRVRGGTIVAMPAFVDTELELFEVAAETESLAASGNVENLPPIEWFQDPDLTEPTPLTLTEDGRLYGHIALWGQCHISFPGCITPPRSNAEYAYYTRGTTPVWCQECGRPEEVAVGPITAGTGHASLSLSKDSTVSHYDNSGYKVAEVAAGEDQHGLWVSGRIAPTATQDQIDSLMSMGVSGDWRRVNGALELVAVLSVPVPGYPQKRRTLAHVASGDTQTALITPAFGAKDETQDERVSKLESVVETLLEDKILNR